MTEEQRAKFWELFRAASQHRRSPDAGDSERALEAYVSQLMQDEYERGKSDQAYDDTTLGNYR